MPTPTSFGSKRRTAPHNGRSNAAKRAAAAAKKKRNNYATFLSAMQLVTPVRKRLERNKAFNNTVSNARSNMNYNTIMYGRQRRMRPLGLTQQQWYALAGALITIQRHPNVNVRNVIAPIATRVRATGRYTNANRNALIAWARSI